MTAVLMSSNGPAEVINARRTESLDAPNILKLVGPSTEPQFGLVNVVNLIEKAVLAVTLNNDKEQILAHSAFFDYPNVPEVDPATWQEWLNTYYDCEKCTPLNTLFMHYFAAKQEFSHGSAREIIRTVFNAVPDIHFLYLIVPNGIFPEPALADIFKPLEKKFGAKPLEKYSIFVCHRHDHAPVLFVRKARVEDHDDLTPIFNRQSDMLKTTYGDYFLAELIESQDEDNHAIIVETEGNAVGFMSISRSINLDLLSRCFELGPFHGLRKPHPEDVLVPPTPPPTAEQPVTADDHEGSQHGPDKPMSRSSSISSKKGDGTIPTPATTVRPGSGSKTTPAGTLPSTLSTPAQPKPGTSASGVESTDVKIQSKLSDVHMASVASLMSEHEDAESVRSTGSKKSESLVSAQGDTDVTPAVPEPSPIPEPALPTPRFDPVYHGESNGFTIQLFCIDEKYEMRSLDFLPMAFSLFPDKEFCILTMPHMVPEFPLLQSFVRVTPKCPSILAQELYVFNRCGLLQSFEVRPACTTDEQGVQDLIQHVDNKEGLMTDLRQFNKARRDPDGTPIQAFVATCLNQVVGVAITRQEEDIEYIRSHYNIEDFIYFNHHRRDEHGHLHHLALNPIFQHQTKHLMKEVLRQAHFTCLYYPVYPPYASEEVRKKHSLVTSLNYMVPVRGRRQIIYPVDQLKGNAPSERILKEKEKYALSHMNRKLTLEPKVTINARVVVVGASDIGMAFLETLAFCPHLRFNNLVLIAPNGLPGELAPDAVRAKFLSMSHCYTQDQLSQVSLRSWVNVVQAKMVAINRGSKYVKVAGGARVPYDHLILCTGQQYQTSCPTGAEVSTKLVTNASLPQSPNSYYKGRVPKNVFTVNDEYDACRVVKWINKYFLNSEGKAIIYGSSLDAYSAVQSLLDIGLPGSRICFIKPPLKYSVTCFNNAKVEEMVHEAIAAEGVQMFEGYYLAQWNDGKGGEELYCASFTCDTKPLKLECSAFFCFNNKAVDYDTFKAINDSCLVFDGKLVIDANFHTNDLAIRGAGPLTKFQRKYHADQWSHANFNSKEVGSALASTMLRLFDPTLETDTSPPIEPVPLIPIYLEAKVKGADLPGGLRYLHFGKPSLDTPLEADMAQLDYGRVLLTGDKEGSSQDYFRLHINQYSNIQTVTCLSRKSVDTSNLLCLYNLHERFLNNLVSRFDEGLITDLYSFFRETWSLAVFHDRFLDFRQEIRELLVQRPAVNVAALEEKVRQLIDQDLQLEKKERKYLEEEFETSGNKRSLETRLLSFLSYNYYHLPMYAKPGMV
ncbi:cilia- and flagella-associated protein 61-like [Asterias rubens]|uniref:cilia- and flagella-associated protein 61-like n=1 Tax=Asterias rubens TaxID=7604 RepID=UPI001455CE75|nr:cilia- and flagella-associated protein 61-like [Asterias rubens]